jgi:CRISPR-associated protein Csc2
MLYGFAVGGGGAQKSRVLTDDAFSLAPASIVTNAHTFNALFDNSTMRNPVTNEPSTSIGEDEYVRPETHFLDIETLKDVTLGELAYVIGNVLRSDRYGAISSRIGKVRNTMAAIIFSDCELFSNLELTQTVYDRVKDGHEQPPFPLSTARVLAAVEESIDLLLPRAMSREPAVLHGPELARTLAGLTEVYRSPDRVQTLLAEIQSGYPAPL